MENLYKEAETEPNISGVSLLDEIRVILEDYLLCDFTETDGGLTLGFKNGQKFALSLKEL